jgi:hypothetical protein
VPKRLDAIEASADASVLGAPSTPAPQAAETGIVGGTAVNLGDGGIDGSATFPKRGKILRRSTVDVEFNRAGTVEGAQRKKKKFGLLRRALGLGGKDAN